MEHLRLPRIEKSLCGCSLQTGTRIIAYIHLIPIAALGIMAFVALVVDEYKYYVRTGREPIDDFSVVFLRNQFEITAVFLRIIFSAALLVGVYKVMEASRPRANHPPGDTADSETYKSRTEASAPSSKALTARERTTTKEDPLLLEPFILFKAIMILWGCIYILTSFIDRMRGRKPILLFIQLFITGLHAYMFTVVYNLRRQLVNRE